MGFQSENYRPTDTKTLDAKEAPAEALARARKLCADYHSTLDKTTYFDSKAISSAAKLLSPFQQINQELLPPSVKLVMRHRLAYLTFIASFDKNPVIGSFFDSLKPDRVDMTSPKAFYESVKNDSQFKSLNLLDLRMMSSSLITGIRALESVNTVQSNWGKEAEPFLRPVGASGTDVRIDDEKAAKNLQLSATRMLQFVNYAKSQMLSSKL